MRVLAVADADSYLKWSAATLDRLPAQWDRRQAVVKSPISPSRAQTFDAAGVEVPPVSLAALHASLVRDPPDVLLLACTGPTVQVLAGLPACRRRRRPVLVTGLPGIAVPASEKAIEFRRGCDLIVAHSRRERTEFAALATTRAPGMGVALGRFPFLTGPADPVSGPRRDVVFAAQAKVPRRPTDREAILLALSELIPAGSAVVKVRALPGERQTHHEVHGYAELWRDLAARGAVRADSVRLVAGPMHRALSTARSLITVSSTAALEAIDRGLPVVVLTDFGVNTAMINSVFEGSGCLGTLADLRAGRAFTPDPRWLVDNYFHPAAEDDLVERLEDLVARRRTAGLPRPSGPPPNLATARSVARLAVPSWVLRRTRPGAQRVG